MLEFYLHHGDWRSSDRTMVTECVPHKISLTETQRRGLSYTASGYGKRIPTRYIVKYLCRWHRVYSDCFSNVASIYIISKGEKITVQTYEVQ